MVQEPANIIRLSEQNGFPWDGSVNVENRAMLPSDAGLYFVVRGASLLYVGMAENLRFRWCGHHRASQFLSGDCIGFMLYPDRDIAELERLAIQLLRPSLNGRTIFRPLREISEEKKAAVYALLTSDNFIRDLLSCSI